MAAKGDGPVAAGKPIERRFASAEAGSRSITLLAELVERLGWWRAAGLCTMALILAALAITWMIDIALRAPAELRVLHLMVAGSITLLLAAPCFAITFRLVENLGRAQHRLLVEIERRIEAEQRLRRLATTDDLTGLHNRRYFVERARQALAVAQRYDQWCSLVIVDIDRFKQLNDRSGHQAGDHALRTLAGILQANLRGTDLAARFGGDEFLVLMPLADLAAARLAAERIRRAIAGNRGDHAFTASIGIAAARGGSATFEELMARADLALYEAKRLGRDRVCAPPGEPSTPCFAPAH